MDEGLQSNFDQYWCTTFQEELELDLGGEDGVLEEEQEESWQWVHRGRDKVKIETVIFIISSQDIFLFYNVSDVGEDGANVSGWSSSDRQSVQII